ncbi:hypothetical protein SORBI_3001G383600 [Sorghum bicolor]|nr:hypothetical protein SORBI_3001G383600 [Sorghum bicolor]
MVKTTERRARGLRAPRRRRRRRRGEHRRLLRQVRPRDALQHLGSSGEWRDRGRLGRSKQAQRLGRHVQEWVRALRRPRGHHGRRGRGVREEGPRRSLLVPSSASTKLLQVCHGVLQQGPGCPRAG